MMAEKDENLLKIRDEYKRLEEECQKLEINKKIWSEEKKKIEKERRDLMDEFYKNKEQMSFELKKEQEYKFTMKQGYEDEVLALRKQVKINDK